MALYSTKELLDAISEDNPCAIGAFNVHNMEYTQGVVEAAEEEDAPVILMIGEPMIPFGGLDMLATICIHAAREARVPVAVALDHGENSEHISRSIELGLSIMIDGSHLLFEDNVALTREAVQLAHSRGLSVEGQIGIVGGSEETEETAREAMTNPEVAAEFVRRTGVDMLAISIGNVHGLHVGIHHLNVERLVAIKNKVTVPLVLHGGSGVSRELSQQAVKAGIRKFNIGTALKYAFSNTLKETLSQSPVPFQPPEVLAPARQAVCRVARDKIRLFGSNGLAKVFRELPRET
jgi:ketose-bisphosphate aldolase